MPLKKKSAAPRHKTKTTRHEMTDVEKGMILAFFYIIQKISVVATLVGCPWSTVGNFLSQGCDWGHIENTAWSGRPALMS